MDAETKIGELLKEIPKASGGDKGNQYTGGKIDSAVDFETPKQQAKQELDIFFKGKKKSKPEGS